MNHEDLIILLCTRQRFGDSYQDQLIAACQEHTLDWNIVFNTSRIHGIAPLVYWNLAKIGFKYLNIPESAINDFEQATQQNKQIRKKSAQNLATVINVLVSESVPMMLIKGEALSRTIYQQQWLISMADIDLILKPKEADLDPSSHQQILAVFEEFNRDTGEKKETFEYDFYMHHDVSMNGIIPLDSERIWQDASCIEVFQHEIFTMSVEDTLITTAINACRKRYFKLKSCFDLAEIISAYPEINWDQVIEKSQAYQCNFILYAALLITKKTVGLSCPDAIIDNLQVSRIRKYIIQCLVNHLLANYSLAELIGRSDKVFLGRKFSINLLLTYATYRYNQIILKLYEIYKNRNNPHGWDPGGI